MYLTALVTALLWLSLVTYCGATDRGRSGEGILRPEPAKGGGGQPQQNEAIDRSCKDRTSTRPSRGGGGKWGFSPCAQGMPFTPCANPGRDGPAHQLRFIEGVIKVNMNIRVEFHHSRWLVICIFYKLPPVNSSRLTVRKYTLSCIHALLDCTWKARHDPCRQ